MRCPFYQVDAFTGRAFGGNPAAVMPLDTWLPDGVLQAIAAENNLSETAFFLQAPGPVFELRWFTPTTEVPLCGHATLAAGFVLSLLGIGGSIYLIATGHDWAGVTLGGINLTGLAGVFVYGARRAGQRRNAEPES